MADETSPEITPQWTAPQPANDALMAQVAAYQNPQNELTALTNNTPPPTPQQQQQMQFNELENLQNARDRLASIPQPDYTPVPRDVQDHMSMIHSALRGASNVLAGPTEYKAIVQPDGSMQVQQVQSTEKEKWARIAAAAIGGAARGMAVGQGPGGAARALAGGFQTGAEIPQQNRQQAEQNVDFNNKQLLAKANRVILQQHIISNTIANQTAQTKFDEDEVARADALQSELDASPWHDSLGTFASMDEAMKAAQTDSNLLKDHAQAKHRIVPVYNKDRTVKGFAAYNEDPGYADRKTTVPTQLPVIKWEPDSDGTMKPTAGTKTVPVGTRQGDIDTATDKYNADFQNAQYKYSQTKKNLEGRADKVPSNYETAYGMAAQATDPAEKKRYTDLGDMLYAKATGLRQITTIKNVAPSNPDSAANWGTLLADPSTGVTLANVPQKERAGVIAAMKAAGQTIAKPLTGQEINRADLANNALLNINKAQEILNRRPDMFGPAGFFSTKFKQALEGGDPDAKDYLTDINLSNLPAVGIHGVKGRWALEDLGKLDSDLYTNPVAMGRVLQDIRDSVGEFAKQGGRQTGPPPPAKTGETKPPPAAKTLPQPLPKVPVRTDGKGNYKQLQNNQWVDVAPPAAR